MHEQESIPVPLSEQVILTQGDKEIARWKVGEFPGWIAQYLDRFPNSGVNVAFRISTTRNSRGILVPPGYLAVKVYTILLKNGLV